MNATCRTVVCAALAWTALVVSATCHAGIKVEVYQGQPFGVGRIRVDLPRVSSNSPWKDDRVAVTEAHGRILMPVLNRSRARRILRQLLRTIELPSRGEFYFLFRGNEPLDITVYSPSAQEFTVRPESDAEEYADLLEDWWEATERHYQEVHRQAEYPIVVENFLTATWARRLDQPMPDPGTFLFRQRRMGATWLAQLTANEAYQAAVERDIVLGRVGAGQPADAPLPHPSRRTVMKLPPPGELPPPADDESIEPIAAHVPIECFYVRFGSFTNYLWFRDFLNHWQGDLGNMIVLRSINHGLGDRLQTQIALRESKLARVMGPRVIRDVAIIGLDAYMRDGPAMGVLFQAKNNMLLSANFNDQRSDAVDQHPDASEKTIQIAGHDVSFLSTPDGRLRSYYAQDGDFHLVTTSRRLVERFFEAGQGEGALADSPDFINTRTEMPQERDDSIFVYLSREFFENLTSPAYRVELDRRLRSIGEMHALELARLSAKAEGLEAHTVDQLIAADLLPPDFGQRADGSKLVEEKAGFRDSVRGTPGWMVPIPDMPVKSLTAAEGARYERFQQLLDREVGRFVPVVAAIGRQTSDDGQLDRITLDVRLAPYSETRMAKWANMLAPADALRVAPIDGDIVSAEIVLGVLNQPVHVFGGLRDFRTPLVVREGQVAPSAEPAQFVRGYIGTWPRPLALLNTFLGPPTGPFDRDGIARNDRLFDLWHRRLDDFFLFSFKRDVLMEVGPQLAMVEPERPAQIRFHVADLSDKQARTAVSGLGYMRARATSASASRFMNSLITELHVPPANAKALAEQLVGGQFECPLGGEYELVSLPEAGEGARQLWVSSATPPDNRFLLTEIPADYEMPLMNWFRGLDVEVLRANDALTLHSELDMTHLDVGPPADEGDEGGGFFSNLLGWGKAEEEKQPSQPVSESDTLPAPPEK